MVRIVTVFSIPHVLLPFHSLATTLPTVQRSITGLDQLGYIQCPLEPQKAFFCFIYICSRSVNSR